ncbi:hypothetical protein [Rhizobium alvei]|uniref:Uncharacterized protein n=1 Tax=Rhizobium alvei TaxID=1132659 RepID=A0ABT8YN05_9HYPH|nr:hypothetical protein [Rhizobium alvei]MDO6964991.1 hypothetical protein [Rhizobium alvei]
MLTGRVDELKNNKIYGWAFNADNPDEHLIIRVMRGTQVLASGVANILRKDLPEAGVGKGDHAFEFAMPPNITSFSGLMVIAQSVRAGEIALPIASNDERMLDELFSIFSNRYDEALIAFKKEVDGLKAQVADIDAAGPATQASIPDDLEERLAKLEARMEATEIFVMRIDETIRRLEETQKAGKRKRLFGLF